MKTEPILTYDCLNNFVSWAKKRHPFNYNKYTKTLTCFGKAFFDLPLAFQLNAIETFADDQEFCIHIEPYLGGGQPAYFASIKYRNKDRVDMQYDVDNENQAEFWTRFEASEMAVKCLNELYNKQIKEANNG